MGRAAALALLALLAVFAAVAVGGASPQPHRACAPCNPGFERAATVYGQGEADIERSTVYIRLHTNGSATWTVRNEVGPDDAALLRNSSNLSAIARAATRSGGLPDPGLANDGLPPARDISARVTDGTVVIRFTQPRAATRFDTVLLSQYFHVVEGGIVINAANYTIVGPPGTTVTNDPAASINDSAAKPTVEGRRVTWHLEPTVEGRSVARHGDTRERRTVVSEQVFLAFAPTGDLLAGPKTTAAISIDVAPTVLEAVVAFLLLQTVVFALMVVSVVRGIRGVSWTHRRSWLGAAVGVLAWFILATVVARVLGIANLPGLPALVFVAPATVYTVVGGLAWHERTRRYLRAPPGQAVAGVAALATVALVAPPFVGGTAAAVKTAVIFAPLAFCFPLGGATAARDRQSVSRWTAATVAAFGFAVVTLVNLADPPGGTARAILSIGLFVAALVVAVLGVPLALFGRSMATSER